MTCLIRALKESYKRAGLTPLNSTVCQEKVRNVTEHKVEDRRQPVRRKKKADAERMLSGDERSVVSFHTENTTHIPRVFV